MYELFAEVQILISEIRYLGDRVVVTGSLRGRGREGGAEVTTPWGAVVDFKDGKGIRISDYLDPQEALEAAGLSE
jgi:ketosteroid isomerase-like protein